MTDDKDPVRGYGTDETPDVETLVEAERKEDGSIKYAVVQIPREQHLDHENGGQS